MFPVGMGWVVACLLPISSSSCPISPQSSFAFGLLGMPLIEIDFVVQTWEFLSLSSTLEIIEIMSPSDINLQAVCVQMAGWTGGQVKLLC